MAFPNSDTICPGCCIDRLIEDPINRERICKGCGLVLPLTGSEPVYSSKNKSLNIDACRLGSDRRFALKDYAGNWIPSRVRSDLMVASKYDREQRKREQAAVSRMSELFMIPWYLPCMTTV